MKMLRRLWRRLFARTEPCPTCGGSRWHTERCGNVIRTIECPTCGGKGVVR